MPLSPIISSSRRFIGTVFTHIFNGLKMGNVRLWNEKLKRLEENEEKQTITI